MILEALGEAALRTLGLVAVLHCLAWLLRVRQPRLLFTAWAVVMVAALAMPMLQRATPPLLPIVPGMPAMTLEGIPLLHGGAHSPGSPGTAVGGAATAIPVLSAAYGLVGGALLLRLLLGLALSWRLASRATPVEFDWTDTLRVRISRAVTAPVTFGTIILLPPDAPTWSPALRAAVIAHERAHVQRRDFVVLLLSQLHRAVFWFSPLSWWLHHHLASLAELASDDRAMAATGDRPGYAAALLEMGRRPGPLLCGLAMARPAALVHRIERVLTQKTHATPASPLRQLGLASAMVALSAMAAGTRSGPGSREIPMPPIPGTDIGHTDGTGRSADARPSIAVPSSIPSPQDAASLPAASAVGRPEEASSPAREARPPSVPPTKPGPSLARAADQKATRATRAAHDAARPVLAAASKPAGATTASGPSGRAEDVSPARTSDRTADGDSQALLPGGTPSCTGMYTAKAASAPNGEQLEMIEARWFKAADGSESLKISLGVRARVKLTGMDVERASVRATVFTRVPAGTGSFTGAIAGANGTLRYECLQLKT